MQIVKQLLPLIASAFILSSGTAMAAGDPVDGKRVFKKCKVCHNAEKTNTRLAQRWLESLAGLLGPRKTKSRNCSVTRKR